MMYTPTLGNGRKKKMTTTETKNVEYTHHAEFDSSVLKEGYYNSDTEDLFIILHSGARLGYKDVPDFIWLYFEQAVSPGRYWNAYVKGQYEGQSGDVSFSEFAKSVDEPKTKVSVTLSVNGELTLLAEIERGKVLNFDDGTLEDFIESRIGRLEYTVKEVRHQFGN